jgi:hypothetical protein
MDLVHYRDFQAAELPTSGRTNKLTVRLNRSDHVLSRPTLPPMSHFMMASVAFPQIDSSERAADFASACLPNGRIDYGVVEREN